MSATATSTVVVVDPPAPAPAHIDTAQPRSSLTLSMAPNNALSSNDSINHHLTSPTSPISPDAETAPLKRSSSSSSSGAKNNSNNSNVEETGQDDDGSWKLNINRFSAAYRHPDDLARGTKKGVREFYENQNSLIEAFGELEESNARQRRRTSSSASTGSASERAATTTGAASSCSATIDGMPMHTLSATTAAPNQQQNAHMKDASVYDPETPEATRRFKAAEISSQPARTEKEKMTSFVLNLSFGINTCILIAITTTTVLSGSIAVIASLVDSALDMASALILYFAARAARKRNFYKYPSGKARIEPVGILIFSALMTVSSVLLINEAVRGMIDNPDSRPDISAASIALLSSVIVVKFILGIFCFGVAKKFRSKESTAEETIGILAQDHRNDVLINSIALVTSFIGAYYWPNADRVGGLVIALYTGHSWTSTCFEQVQLLTGKTATPSFLQKLTWLAWNHDKRILYIDTVRSFTFGQRFLVEVDIVLPPNMPLKEAHDIGESLQQKIEALEDVERAFVHLDHEVEHSPAHEHPSATGAKVFD